MTERMNMLRIQDVEKHGVPPPFNAERDISESDIKKVEKLYDSNMRDMMWPEAARRAAQLHILRPDKRFTLDASQAAGVQRQLRQLQTQGELANYLEFAADVHMAFPDIPLQLREDTAANVRGLTSGRLRVNLIYDLKVLSPSTDIPLTEEDKTALETMTKETRNGPGLAAMSLVRQKALIPEDFRMTKGMWTDLTNELHSIKRDPSILATFASNLELLAADGLRFGEHGLEVVRHGARDDIPPIPETVRL